MSSGDTVMIAIDGSGESNKAFEWYKEKLYKEGDRVLMISALETPVVPTRESWDKLEEAGNKKRKELQENCKKLLQVAGLQGTVLADFERPGQYICSEATKNNAAYIVMGSRGMGTVRRTILGSVSDYVVHHAHCPVLIYKK